MKSILLTNILAFANVEVPLARLTLLTGGNSGGKTSVLRALAMLRQSYGSEDTLSDWILNGELISLGTGRDLLYAEPVEITDMRKGGMRIELVLAESSVTWSASYDSAADILPLSSSVRKPDASLFSSNFQYLQADRIVPSPVFPKSYEAVNIKRWLGVRGENTANYLRVYGERTISSTAVAHPSARSLGLLDQTEAWLNELSPGTRIEILDVPGTEFVRLSFSRAGSDVRTPSQRSTNVGFGLTYALPIIVACLSASEGGLIVVENPEAHLHPAAQSIVGRLCAYASIAGSQVIVETHSDHVLNATRLLVKQGALNQNAVVFNYFWRTEENLQPSVQSMAVALDGSVSRWPSGFFDQWDKDLDALLDD